MIVKLLSNSAAGSISLLCLLLGSLAARADYIHPTLAERSGTIMEFAIEADKVVLSIEIDSQDESVFANLLDPTKGALETSFIETGDGVALTGTVQTRESRQRTERLGANAPAPVDRFGQPIPLPDISPIVTYVEIEYPFDTPPDRLTLFPPMEEDRGVPAASIGFIAFHEQLPVTNFWYLAGPETLNLDWEDPWYSRFENRNLTRPHQSSLSSYLYIEPYEIRHEITIRIVDRVQFMEVDRRGVFQVLQNPQEAKTASTIVGVSLTYLTDGIPEEVAVQWDLFNDRIQSIPAQITDPAGPFPYLITPDENVLVWKNFLTSYAIPQVEYLPVDNRLDVPVGSIVFGGAGDRRFVVVEIG